MVSTVHFGLRSLFVLLLCLWLGAMLFFGLVVAPSAFAALPTRQLAGDVVTAALTRLNYIGYYLGPFLMVLAVFSARQRRLSNISLLVSLLLLFLMTTSAIVSNEYITPQMLLLRSQMGDIIDKVPQDNPLRIRFNVLHNYSVRLMAFNLIAGLLVFLLLLRDWKKDSRYRYP